MATKKAQNGQYLEYVVIRPVGGLTVDQIATAILMWHSNSFDFDTGKVDKNNVREFFKKYNTWNKVMGRVKYIIYDEGMMKLDYAWENIEQYDSQLANVTHQLKNMNNLIGRG
tara:strand:- start:2374 stop:2712 length:339 start_codon:yes stop_codon:yes gene_type:complete